MLLTRDSNGAFLAVYGVSLVDILFVDWNLTLNAMLVLGLADAAGEVFGTRWGRRKFAVRDLYFGSTHHRSWEGSIAVLLTTIMVLFVRGIDPLHAIDCAAAVALTSLVPRSFDNFTIPLTVAATSASRRMPQVPQDVRCRKKRLMQRSVE